MLRGDMIHVRGFDIDIGAAGSISVSSILTNNSFDLSCEHEQCRFVTNAARATEPTSAYIAVRGTRGNDSFLEVDGSISMEGSDDVDEPGVGLKFPTGGKPVFRLRAEHIELKELNRMRGVGSNFPEWVSREESMRVHIFPQGTRLAAVNMLANSQESEINIRFAPGELARSTLFSSSPSLSFDLAQGIIEFAECISVAIKVDEQEIPRLPSEVSYPIRVDASSATLSYLTVASQSHEQIGNHWWPLPIKVGGQLNSIKLGEREMAPTYLDLFVRGSMLHRGKIGTLLTALLIVSVFAWIAFFYRGIDYIIRRVIPREGEIVAVNNVRINQSGQGNIINIAEYMKDVTNIVEGNARKSPNSEAAQLIVELTKAVEKIAPQVDGSQAEKIEEMGKDLKALSEELKSAAPRRKWYELSLEGIKEAAVAVGELGTPILALVQKLAAVLAV